jgi:hypothetical protein
MSETTQTAKMAQRLSKELFAIFGWNQIGPEDHDWACASQELHSSQTHPSDLVMWYDDPYEDCRIVLNSDLKSYGVGSLTKAKVRGAIRSLCKATDCANVSVGWRNLYDCEGVNYQVHGLLFIYNHDGQYHGDFDGILDKLEDKELLLSNRNRVHVFSPATVSYLEMISHDIELEKARRVNAGKSPRFSFYYPDLVELHPKTQNKNCASIEALQSAWQIVRIYGIQQDPASAIATEYLVYYRGQGETVDEFKYMLDAFFRYQMLGDDESITLKMPFASQNAAAKFQQAKDAYASDFYELKEFKSRLGRIQLGSIKKITDNFSTVQLGMDYHE